MKALKVFKSNLIVRNVNEKLVFHRLKFARNFCRISTLFLKLGKCYGGLKLSLILEGKI